MASIRPVFKWLAKQFAIQPLFDHSNTSLVFRSPFYYIFNGTGNYNLALNSPKLMANPKPRSHISSRRSLTTRLSRFKTRSRGSWLIPTVVHFVWHLQLRPSLVEFGINYALFPLFVGKTIVPNFPSYAFLLFPPYGHFYLFMLEFFILCNIDLR